MSKRTRLFITLAAASVAVILILPAFNAGYADGRYLLTVRLDLPPRIVVKRLAYMPFFDREMADFVIERSPEFDGQFTTVDLSSESEFEASIAFGERIAWFGASVDRRQERFLVLLLDMSDGTQRRIIVDVPDLQNREDRSVIVHVEPLATDGS